MRVILIFLILQPSPLFCTAADYDYQHNFEDILDNRHPFDKEEEVPAQSTIFITALETRSDVPPTNLTRSDVPPTNLTTEMPIVTSTTNGPDRVEVHNLSEVRNLTVAQNQSEVHNLNNAAENVTVMPLMTTTKAMRLANFTRLQELREIGRQLDQKNMKKCKLMQRFQFSIHLIIFFIFSEIMF